MEIVPYEKMEYNDNHIAIDDISITYIQRNDCTENEDVVQTLTVSCRNNGIARFINIKTDNWSINSIKELEEVLNDFEQRAEIK